jgi:DNA-binding CsgD family transcriptional regulator
MTLSLADLDRLVTVLPTLYQVDDLSQFPERVIHVLKALFPATGYSYNDVDATRGRIVELMEPFVVLTPELRPALEHNLLDHPAVAHFIETADGRPHAISDFISRTEFRRRPLYGELYRATGSEDQLSIGIGKPPRFVGVCVNRDRWEFDARDRLMLDMLRSHLGAAYRAASERTLSQQIIAAGNLGVVRLDMDGRSITVDDLARASLAEVYTDWPPRSRMLPGDLAAWVRVQRQNFEADPSAPLEPLMVEHRHVRVQIRFVPGTLATGASLILRRNAHALTAAGIRQLGLSPREGEVLQLLVTGASSTEIAAALVVSPNTVSRHLHNLYQKLGVSSRTGAIARARAAESL